MVPGGTGKRAGPRKIKISRLHFSGRDISNAILLFGILLCRDGGLALLGGGLAGRGLCGFRVGSLRVMRYIRLPMAGRSTLRV